MKKGRERIIKIIKNNSNLLIIILFLFMTFLLIDHIVGKSIMESSLYNSYELQAKAWLNGKVYLDQDYSHLELAIYKGHYFVSFPPLPSVLILPFVAIFKDNVPTNLVMFFLLAFEFSLIYKILKRYKTTEINAILVSLGFTIGTNLMSLSIDGGVWFFAQLLNNLLCILAVDSFLKKKKTLVYFYLALAVGCRPFSILYMLMFFIYYLKEDQEKNYLKKFINNIYYLLPAIIIGTIYMCYNYIRFDNILEFGHNYLPEFIEAEHGQFSLQYLLPNLKKLCFSFIKINNKLDLSFGFPFCFLIANPVIVLYLYRLIKNYLKEKKIDYFRLLIFIFTSLNILLICMHRTLGEWQFGARYTCDILPILFLGIIWYKDKTQQIKPLTLDKFEICCLIFGIILNVFGAIILHLDKLF